VAEFVEVKHIFCVFFEFMDENSVFVVVIMLAFYLFDPIIDDYGACFDFFLQLVLFIFYGTFTLNFSPLHFLRLPL